jgi:hypothetical protein
MQFEKAQYSKPPILRLLGIEEEDDDEYENEHLQVSG